MDGISLGLCRLVFVNSAGTQSAEERIATVVSWLALVYLSSYRGGKEFQVAEWRRRQRLYLRHKCDVLQTQIDIPAMCRIVSLLIVIFVYFLVL
jgi:hypothetical protein